MNFICFIAVLSAANSAIYASSRSLMALARDGKAPVILAKTSKAGVPVYGIILTVCIACVVFLVLVYSSNAAREYLSEIKFYTTG
jgi:amino acid permease